MNAARDHAVSVLRYRFELGQFGFTLEGLIAAALTLVALFVAMRPRG